MRKFYSVILVILFPIFISAQELMTINQVFDFEINDEFHFKSTGENILPNADRIKIIGKYYSADNDTLNYIRFHDSYWSEIIWGDEPYFEYHFSTETDTLSLWNLDSSISSYDYWIQYQTSMYSYDTIIDTDNDLCGVLSNGFTLSTNDFEHELISRAFGEGLGMTEIGYSYPSENYGYQTDLFYYKKGYLECGIADTNAVSIIENEELDKINIYPIPAQNYLRIENSNTVKLLAITLTDINGHLIRKYGISETILDLSDIPAGFYFLNISSTNERIVKKIFIE